MSLKRTKGRESRKPRTVGSGRGNTGSGKVVLASRSGSKVARAAGPRLATAKVAPKIAVKTTLKPPASTVKVAVVKHEAKPATRPAVKLKAATKLALAEIKAPAKPERIHSHPTMCLHCHLIVEMFHERGADPVKGAWQCPRCGHKYLFSHWKIKRQARGKPEAA
jgi:DNA-directed RNA polymerase subunit RPC12/RpoP